MIDPELVAFACVNIQIWFRPGEPRRHDDPLPPIGFPPSVRIGAAAPRSSPAVKPGGTSMRSLAICTFDSSVIERRLKGAVKPGISAGNSVFLMAEAELGERVYVGRFCSIGFAKLDDEVMLEDGAGSYDFRWSYRIWSTRESRQNDGYAVGPQSHE